jgi:hypothetical protein
MSMPPRGSKATGTEPPADDDAGQGSGPEGEASAVTEPGAGELEESIASLGEAVTANQQGEQGTADAEGQHNASIEAMDNITEALRITTEEAVFDARDFMLEQIKHRPKPWSATSQIEQREVAAKCENAARELVRQIVEAVASNGTQAIRVLLTKVNAGGDDIVVTGKVKLGGAEPTEQDTAILALHHAIGKHVMLTRATVEDYAGQGREAETEPDQQALGFEAGSEDEED